MKYRVEIKSTIEIGRCGIRCVLFYIRQTEECFLLAKNSDAHKDMLDLWLKDNLGGYLYQLEKMGEVIPLGGGFIEKTSTGVIVIGGSSVGLGEYYSEHKELFEMYPSISSLEGRCSGGMPASLLKEMEEELLRQTGAKELDLSSLEERDEMMTKKIGDRLINPS